MAGSARSRPSQFLDREEPHDGLAILVQGSPAPVLRGREPDGFDYLCPYCTESCVVENTVVGEFWDLTFRCFLCQGVSTGPRLPPGMPLPRPLVAVLPGEHRIEGTLELRHGSVMVGAEAVERRARETGEDPWNPGRKRVLEAVTRESLEELARKGKDFLGDWFEKISAKAARLRAAHGDSARRLHRLITLVERVQLAASTLDRPVLDVYAIVELEITVEAFERWRNDPAWAAIRVSLRHPGEYLHSVVTLMTASYLTDAGNGVGLMPSKAAGRRPDLWLAAGPRGRMMIEVKVPEALRDRANAVTAEEAREIVSAQIDRAGTGSRGQLSDEYPGLLLIGGFHLGEDDLDRLEEAARRLLATPGSGRSHLAGIILVTVGVLIENPILEGGRLLGNEQTRFTGMLDVRIALNPRYRGTIQIDTSKRRPPTP